MDKPFYDQQSITKIYKLYVSLVSQSEMKLNNLREQTAEEKKKNTALCDEITAKESQIEIFSKRLSEDHLNKLVQLQTKYLKDMQLHRQQIDERDTEIAKQSEQIDKLQRMNQGQGLTSKLGNAPELYAKIE